MYRNGERIRSRRKKKGKRDKDGRKFMTTMPGEGLLTFHDSPGLIVKACISCLVYNLWGLEYTG